MRTRAYVFYIAMGLLYVLSTVYLISNVGIFDTLFYGAILALIIIAICFAVYPDYTFILLAWFNRKDNGALRPLINHLIKSSESFNNDTNLFKYSGDDETRPMEYKSIKEMSETYELSTQIESKLFNQMKILFIRLIIMYFVVFLMCDFILDRNLLTSFVTIIGTESGNHVTLKDLTFRTQDITIGFGHFPILGYLLRIIIGNNVLYLTTKWTWARMKQIKAHRFVVEQEWEDWKNGKNN